MKKSLLISLLVCFPIFFYAQTTTTFSVAGSQTFVSPAGITAINVQAWGAGGAGGSSTNPGFDGARGGSGGGGGAFASAPLTITSGASLTVVVGTGGKGVTGANGNVGGFSAITGFAIKADGGKGGLLNNGNNPLGGLGGASGASIGTVTTSGATGLAGEFGFTDDTGALISSGAGGNAANGGGTGGIGITGAFVSSVGNAGNAPGGGGSGGRSSLLQAPRRGGDGGDGKVIISYDCPTYSLFSTDASVVNVCSGSSSEITLTGNLPIGLYKVSYEIQGVAQTPATMNVATAGTGSFIASGFTTVGSKFIKITALTSGSSTVASENCTSATNANNLATVTVNSSGTAPVALAFSGATCTQVTANWQAVSGATYYELDVSTDNAFATFVAGYSARNVGNVLTFNITGLTNNTYYYRVRAYNGTCISTNSNVITYTNPVAPSAPTGNTVTGNACTQFTANWNSMAGATSYNVQWSVDNFNTVLGSVLNITAISYTITGLINNTQYKYKVTAVNRCGSNTFTSANVRTMGSPPGNVNALLATSILCNFFNANWTSLGNAATSYLLDVSQDNFVSYVGVYHNYDVGNVSTFQVSGLTSGTTYQYRLKAKSGCGISALYSNTRIVSTLSNGNPPAAPTNVSAPSASILCTGFTMSWTASAGALDYTVEISTSAVFPASPPLPAITQTFTGVTTTTYTFTGLTPGTNYYYRVLARNSCGSSLFVSSPASNVMTLAVPAVPVISPVTSAICQTDGQNLAVGSPNASYTYVWSTGETGSSIFVTSAGSYTVKAVNSGGCTSANSAASVVSIEGLPTAIAGGSKTICSNQPVTVTGASATNGTIKWTFSGGAGTLTNDTTLTPTYTPTVGGAARTVILTMTVTSINSCAPQIATATYTINIQGAPTASISGSQSTCSNGSITLAAGEANASNGTILWTHDGAGTISAGATTLTPTYTAVAADAGKQVTLTMTVTASPSCSVPYTVTDIYPVIVRAENTVTAASSSPILCINAMMPDITHTTTGATGIGVPLNLPAGVSASWVSNRITISGTPTESGTFNYSIPLTGGCSVVNAIGSIIVNLNTVGPASIAPTTCSTAVMPNITHTTTGATGIGIPVNLPTGVSASWASDIITISGTPTESGIFNYNIPLTGGCGVVSATGTIIVNILPSTPISGTIVQPTCITPTGSIELTGLLSTPTWLITQSGIVSTTYGGSGTSFTIPNLIPGTYTFTIQEGTNCPSLPTISLEIKAPITNIWNGVVWSKGSDPVNTDSIEFAADYQSTGNLSGCSCKVDSGKNVTINSDHTLTIDNGLTVESATGASLTFENNASLLQVNDAVNIGDIVYKRNTSPVRRYDFTCWSSPVTRTPAFTLHDLSPNTLGDKYYRYNAITDSWVIIYNGAAPMVAGVGYIIRGPQNSDTNIPAVYNGSFNGVPNNGLVSVSLGAAEKWSLIGNPYPSAVYADQFIFDNSANLYGTLYFWTHNSSPSNAIDGGTKYYYTTDDYALYNLTGSVSVGTLSGNGATTSGNQNPPLGYIAAGQSFFAKSKTGLNVVFTNSMRIAGHDGQFFKISNSNVEEKNRVWLNLTNTQGAFKQLLIGYLKGATNNWDDNYDGVSMDGNKYVDFYSINETKNLVVQGRALPFDEADLVPLGYRSTIAGDFTIAIDHADGNLSTHAIYLEDKVTGVIHDLRLSNYTFTTAIGTFSDRFVLRYTNKTLGTVDFENLDNTIFVSVKDKIIKVTSSKEALKEVVLYDVSGKMLYNKKKIGNTELQILNLQSGNQVLLVKVSLENGHLTSRKIIF